MPSYFLRLYRAFLTVSLLENIQYRASGVIWMLGSILEPTIYLIVWTNVAESRGGSVGGFTPSEFAAYYIVLLLINHLTFSWIMQVFQFRIQYGHLSYELLRPIHPIHGDITDNVAYKVVQMTVMIPALVILIILFEPAFSFSFESVAMALPVIVIAFLVRFLLEWSLALAAFWTTRITAINNTYFAVMMFVSGRIAPLALLPPWLQSIAEVLPFYYVVAFPVEIVNGRLTGEAVADGVFMLLVWLAIAFAIMRTLWKQAIKTFAAVGG